MNRFFRRPNTVGQAAGSLDPIEKHDPQTLEITMFTYGEGREVEEQQLESLGDCIPFDKKVPVTWLNVNGSYLAEILKDLGDRLDIHPLVLEDILDTSQRPNVQDFDSYLYIELNMLSWNEALRQIESQQVSIILGENFVISFQEYDRGVLSPVRKRIREGKARLVKQGADYLAYVLINSIVDHYFIVLENLGEQIEMVEEELVTDPVSQTLQAIHELKRELIFLRKSVWPLREAISTLERGDSPLFKSTSLIYLRDVYDHAIQIIDTIETFRDMTSGMLDIYLSSVSNRMNEIMKVLTIIATVFIPLSFIVGLYGMNFEFMPELHWKWGYLMVWGVIISVVVVMLAYFRRKKWL